MISLFTSEAISQNEGDPQHKAAPTGSDARAAPRMAPPLPYDCRKAAVGLAFVVVFMTGLSGAAAMETDSWWAASTLPEICNSTCCSHVAGNDSAIAANYYFPCSNTITGNLLLIALYGVILGLSAKAISDGAELLLDIGMAWQNVAA